MSQFVDPLAGQAPVDPSKRRKGIGSEDKRAAIALRVVEVGTFERRVVTLAELAELVGDVATNHVGTIVGAGQSGRGGLGLYRDKDGNIIVSYKNVRLASPFVRPEDYDAMLRRHGVDMDEFVEKVMQLPDAPVADAVASEAEEGDADA